MNSVRMGGFFRGVFLAIAVFVFLSVFTLSGCGPQQKRAGLTGGAVVALQNRHLHNLHRLDAEVYAGAQPDGAAGFAELQALGVKTAISVDGALPDEKTAARYGLRYIHLPIGYDGVPAATQQAIAKAIVEADGPVYIHCHHGKHRGAAAAAAACVVAGRQDPAQALATLKAMHTGENYVGLWRDVEAARPISLTELRAMPVTFQAAQPPPPLVAGMVTIDAIVERLQACSGADWQAPADHPDVDPAHEALMLKEAFAELQRSAEFAKRPADYRQWMAEGEKSAAALETALRDRLRKDGIPVPRHSLLAPVTAAWDNVKGNCLACHKPYRNLPQE